MDIQAASNFERFLFFLLGRNPDRLREVMAEVKSKGRIDLSPLPPHTFRASRMSDAEIPVTIARLWREHAYLVDPHTACAFTDMAPARTSVVLATAHPAKFPDVVTAAIGSQPTHPALEALKNKPMRTWPLAPDAAAIKQFIVEKVRSQ
jgi:threonine synthase